MDNQILTQEQKAVIERVTELLAKSPLAQDIKTTLLENFDKLPAYAIFALLDALEKEDEALNELTASLSQIIEQKEADWSKIEQEQKTAMDEIIDRVVREEEKKAQIQQLKDSIQ